MNYITVDGNKYLIRGPYKAKDLRNLFDSFKKKYPDVKTTFSRWLVANGKVYVRVKKNENQK